ncbi:MAG: 3,4-dihydroxyphenylacetate 2,3-dioxygenase [Hyphomicrobiales bacterium]|nr:3,4-dihydroxyphenylacetate 2,3-dioxygenase [Hyphomicrobiales bacterium]
MQLPVTARPDFHITRASHVVLQVADLDASREFYTQVLGLVVTAQEDDVLYLRGIEEACHHSLVLRKAPAPSCARIGLRMFSEDDLEASLAFFSAHGCEAKWVDVAHQGKTLHVTDPVGVPLEFCARMPVEPRMITRFAEHRGGRAQRIDHYQIVTPHVPKALEAYTAMGFGLSEYIATARDELRGVFLQRKGNPHDIVFFHGPGPRLHHFAYFTPEGQDLLRACDVAGALGFGRGVERGPGRHGPGHAMFVYFRDPDGHRVELFNTHYQVMDIENEPVRWDPADTNVSFPWGLPAQRRWFEETTAFEGVETTMSDPPPAPLTLERYLAELP